MSCSWPYRCLVHQACIVSSGAHPKLNLTLSDLDSTKCRTSSRQFNMSPSSSSINPSAERRTMVSRCCWNANIVFFRSARLACNQHISQCYTAILLGGLLIKTLHNILPRIESNDSRLAGPRSSSKISPAEQYDIRRCLRTVTSKECFVRSLSSGRGFYIEK
jgi:hypothetical protein